MYVAHLNQYVQTTSGIEYAVSNRKLSILSCKQTTNNNIILELLDNISRAWPHCLITIAQAGSYDDRA